MSKSESRVRHSALQSLHHPGNRGLQHKFLTGANDTWDWPHSERNLSVRFFLRTASLGPSRQRDDMQTHKLRADRSRQHTLQFTGLVVEKWREATTRRAIARMMETTGDPIFRSELERDADGPRKRSYGQA
jgi:hypothetical protein